MSHFYGTMRGSRGATTRCGHKTSGIRATAASWKGAVRVEVYYDQATGEDKYEVRLIPWHGAGRNEVLATGTL